MLTYNGFEVFIIMDIINPSTDVHRVFFGPLWPCLEPSPHQRQCLKFPDTDYLEIGLSRVLLMVQSGRDLLQRLSLLRPTCPANSNFFESLKSDRRLAMVQDVADRLRHRSARTLPDRLAKFFALDAFDVYAGDGHSHDHACHDAAVDGAKLCITHLYTRNLRDDWLSHLSLCEVKEKGNHHDMAVLKSLDPATLRQGAKKGRKVRQTNEMTLPPGLIAHLYKMRWNIEKSFDEFKNKLHEAKAWGSSENAKRLQAQFLCLAVNLLSLLNHHLESNENVRNEAEIARRQQRLDAAIEGAAKIGRILPLALRKLQHLTQHSVKLTRWVAALLFHPVPWDRAVSSLRASYAQL